MDEGSFRELFGNVRSRDPLDFPGYAEKLSALEQKTGLREAVITGTARIGGYRTALAVMDSPVHHGQHEQRRGREDHPAGGICRQEETAAHYFLCLGRRRMQEGIYSLMQMAKTSAAIGRLGEAGCLYISVLTNPTTGGVTASFASLGDIILAEPKALIGFAGPRVIEQTIKQKLPEGFQRAEFLQECGFVDEVVPRSEMRGVLIRLLRLHSGEVRRNG